MKMEKAKRVLIVLCLPLIAVPLLILAFAGYWKEEHDCKQDQTR